MPGHNGDGRRRPGRVHGVGRSADQAACHVVAEPEAHPEQKHERGQHGGQHGPEPEPGRHSLVTTGQRQAHPLVSQVLVGDQLQVATVLLD